MVTGSPGTHSYYRKVTAAINFLLNDQGAAVPAHTHIISDITGLQAALDGKALLVHSHSISDVTGLTAALADKSDTSHTHTFASLTSKPTTLSGYGITDAASSSHTHSFASLTSKPTTLAGYNITDAAPLVHTHVIGDITGLVAALAAKSDTSHTHTFASLTSKPTTLGGYGITDAASSTHTHTFASLTSKPTTLAGYGITDAASLSHTHSIYLQLAGGTMTGSFNTAVGVKFSIGNTGTALFDCDVRGNIGSMPSSGLGAIYVADNNFNSATYATTAPGLGAVVDGHGVAAALGFYVHDGTTTRRQILLATAHTTPRLEPTTDNNTNLGSASKRFGTVYAGTGAINTSDEQEKNTIAAIPSAWLDAWAAVAWLRYKFNGSNLWNTGSTAQRVAAALTAKSIDPATTALVTKDQLDDGSWRWGLRYDQCFAVEAAWNRRRIVTKYGTIAANGTVTIAFGREFIAEPTIALAVIENSGDQPVTLNVVSWTRVGGTTGNYTGCVVRAWRAQILPSVLATLLGGFNVFGGTATGVRVSLTATERTDV